MKVTIGLGNTCGPKFEPVKVYIEYTADIPDDEECEGIHALQQKVLADVHDYCYDALLRLKGEPEANKYQSERAGKEGV